MSELKEAPMQEQSDSVEIPEKDRVPIPQKISFGFGIVSDHLATFSLNSFTMPIFNIILQLSPSLIGYALMIARLWDAFTDPLIGSLSDNSKSPKGRRKPFVFWGALLTGAFFPFLWLAPVAWSQTLTFIYLVGALLIYFTFYSIFSVPYQSLGMELTPNYRERTNVYSWMSYIQQISSFTVPWLLALTTLSVFRDELQGTRIVSIGVGIAIAAAGVLPALFCVEKFSTIAQTQKKENPLKSLRSLSKNRPLIFVFAAIGTYLLAISATQALDVHVKTYYIYGGDLKEGAFLFGYDGTLRVVFSFVAAFLIQALSKKFDKKHLILACIATIFICKIGILVTYIPGKPLLTFITKPFLSMGETGFWILILSMRADVADWDEYKFGRRREGLIAAVGNWIAKLSMTAAMALGGIVLQYIAGFDVSLGGNQSPETLSRLIWSYALIPASAAAAMFILMIKYPLTHNMMADVRATLEERRDAV
ncbi:MFS transporter [Pelagicoccus sp. SDUM812003]|uniref:MFS transporter n=1 Tax=Pelagicoccus sp. SDUM812003 TaxID=3041267 RepID=UPI00281063F5|nr:MFS transporter [Pelagicoccus sp. SDUM812003]MDQ8201448.1 MFS transporter [Pelagicoccus sp. SDUM812003]